MGNPYNYVWGTLSLVSLESKFLLFFSIFFSNFQVYLQLSLKHGVVMLFLKEMIVYISRYIPDKVQKYINVGKNVFHRNGNV